MSKKSNRNKQLDLQVVDLLQKQGIFNQVRAQTLTNLAIEVQSSSLDSVKCYKTIKTDNDYKLANEMVFEYLKRHNMENTIKCIQSETENKLSPTPISNNIQNDLNIPQKENVLYHTMQFYFTNMNDIFEKYHKILINNINERIQNIGKSSPKTNESKSPKATTTPISKSNSNVSQPQISKTQNPAKKEESSSIEFDINDDDIPPPSKSPTNQKSATQKVKSESSAIDFDDTSDFDKPATTKPAAKPAASTQPTQSVKKVSDSEFSDFDEDLELEDNITPSPKQTKSTNQAKPKNDDDDNFDLDIDDDIVSLPKQNKSPNQSKPKNEMDDSFDDDEPPLINNNQAKPQPNNDDIDDSLQDFDDSL